MKANDARGGLRRCDDIVETKNCDTVFEMACLYGLISRIFGLADGFFSRFSFFCSFSYRYLVSF